eukprot:6181478-Prymnesium_polylepis.1
MRMHWTELARKDEALYELKAVEYAVAESDLDAPLATMAGGSGSIQITGLDNFLSFNAALKEGESVITGAEDRGAAVAEWKGKVLSSFKAAAATSGGFTDQVMELGREDEVDLVCISTFYYAALAAGIVKKGVTTYEYHRAPEVLAKLKVLFGSAEAKDVANAVRLHSLLEALFEDGITNVRCLFARDWSLAGKEFRTTWTTGWWLSEREA